MDSLVTNGPIDRPWSEMPPPGGETGAMQQAAFVKAMQAAAQAEGGGSSPEPSADAPTKTSPTDKRPEGDTRSAQEIIDGDPTLKNLGNQSDVKDNLKKQVGDFETDPDAAYRASAVLQHIKSSATSGGKERSGDVTNNGKIEGFTKDGDARRGTEAGLLQDFGRQGYSILKDDQKLDTTNDEHVKQDGTNLDNIEFVGHKITKGISDAAGWFSDRLNELPGPLKSFLGPLHIASEAVSGGMNVANTAINGGDVERAGKDMASGVLNVGANIVKGVGELAGETLGKVPGVGKFIAAGAETMTTAVAGSLNVADTAIQGGDTKAAAEEMGYDTAQTAVESAVGVADPTGVVSGKAGEEFRGAVDKNGDSTYGDQGGEGGSPVGDLGAEALAGSLGDFGGPSRKKGASGDGGSPKGGVSEDKDGGTTDRSPPKRTAEDAGLPDRADDPKASKPDISTNGTYGDREKEKERLEIQTGSGTHQSEHVVGYSVLHGGDRRNNRPTENAMPAYHEQTGPHRAHAGTGSSSNPTGDRADRTGWPSSADYRNDQRAAMQDPIARRDGTSVSNAVQLNQLGYGQQRDHEMRQTSSRPPADSKADNSYNNMIRNDPPIAHTIPGTGPGTGPATDRLGPRGQAEAVLARETQVTGRYPTPEREAEVRKMFGV